MALQEDFSQLTHPQIVEKIKDQMKSNPNFLDYDFDGSRLRVLIDAMAYSTLYQAAYANAAVSETWRPLARNRQSVVQLAQNIGYIPSSITAGTALVNISAKRTGGPVNPFVTLKRGCRFSGQLDAKTYKFVLTKDIDLILGAGNLYHASDVTIAQGMLVKNTYTWEANQRIVLKAINVDRRYTSLYINGKEWLLADNAARNKANNVFYMRETLEGWTEVYFGVGDINENENMFIGGDTPNVGDSIIVEYLTTDGAEANGTSEFKIISSIPNHILDVTSYSRACSGGDDAEYIEDIRSRSDKMFQSQNRCVTPLDYETFIKHEFDTMLDAVRCWTQRGDYGYAYIAAKPKQGLLLTNEQITAITKYITKYNVSVVAPKFISPVYIFINHTIDVDYDPNLLDTTVEDLKANIIQSISNYYSMNIDSFDDSYQNSKLTREIDNTHKCILGTRCDIDIVKEFEKTAWWNLSRGSSISTTIDAFSAANYGGLSTYEFTYDEYDDSTVPPIFQRSHKLQVMITESDKLILGPFTPTKLPDNTYVPSPIVPCDDLPGISGLYTDDDFVLPDILKDQDPNLILACKYYLIGSVERDVYGETKFTQINFDDQVHSFRWDVNNIKDDYIRYKLVITDTSVYPSQGEIIVFDPALRPEYITLTPKSITTT